MGRATPSVQALCGHTGTGSGQQLPWVLQCTFCVCTLDAVLQVSAPLHAGVGGLGVLDELLEQRSCLTGQLVVLLNHQ